MKLINVVKTKKDIAWKKQEFSLNPNRKFK